MPQWPECVLDEFETSLETYMPDFDIVRRALRPQDPPRVLSMRAGAWMPDESSWEMPSTEVTISNYTFEIEVLVKHADEELGREMHAEAAKTVRAVLCRDSDLMVRLRSLNEVLMGMKERFLRMKVVSQQYATANRQNSWFFVSKTRVVVATETTEAP